MYKRFAVILSIVCIISVLVNVYFIFFGNSRNIVSINKNGISVNNSRSQYPLLSRRAIQSYNDILLNFLNLRSDIKDTTDPWGNNFSMYFEYLPTGVSIGVNSTEEFHQASLFKLPVVMAYYHQLERLKNPTDPLVTIQKQDLDDQFGDLYKKGPGYKIKLSDAVKLALQNSDNTAIKLITPRITKQDFDDVYSSLDIDLQTDNNGAVITTKGYSSILKALYFSSVLEPNDSQYILDLLTQTKFVDKLPAGVPQNIPIAHKIGVFNKVNGEDEAYMDCGIVYLPNRPYSLCMYSKSDEQTARDRMKTISQMVYDYVSSTQK